VRLQSVGVVGINAFEDNGNGSEGGHSFCQQIRSCSASNGVRLGIKTGVRLGLRTGSDWGSGGGSHWESTGVRLGVRTGVRMGYSQCEIGWNSCGTTQDCKHLVSCSFTCMQQ